MEHSSLEPNRQLQMTLHYARLGLLVIPIRPPGAHSGSGKEPLTSHGYKDGNTEPGAIRRWFARYPTANVAIVTGKKSGVLVFDIDAKSNGYETLRALERKLGPLPRTWTVETGGGGQHLYFEHPEFDVPKDNAGKLLGRGVDVIGDGGYVVAPPSRHATGKLYRWVRRFNPGYARPAKLPRAWLRHIRAQLDAQKPSAEPTPAQGLVSATIPEGMRNPVLTSLAGKLRRDGLDFDAIFAALRAHNKAHCDSPLADTEVEKIARSVSAYPAALQPGVAAQDTANEVAKQLLVLHYGSGEHLLYQGGQFWWFCGTHWKPLSTEVLQGQLLKIIEATSVEPRMRFAAAMKDAITLLQSRCARDGDPLRFIGDPPRVLNCRNGELWLKDDGSVELKPHRADTYLRHVMDVDYDPKASCPEYDRAILAIFAESTDPKDMAAHWDELMGYLIQPTRPHALILVLLGSGNNGKTKLIELVIRLVGRDAVYSGRIEELDSDRFTIGSLLWKLIFVDDDIRAGTKLPDGGLKKISEEKELTGERKFKDKFNFRCRAVPVLLCNSVPYLADLSHGMLRRLQVVPFDRKFTEKDDDKDLFKRIEANELSGVLNRAIEGWERLQRRRKFKLPRDVINACQAWLAQAHPLEAFIDGMCLKDPGARCLLADFYVVFQNWAKQAGYKSIPHRLGAKRDLEHRGYQIMRRNRGQTIVGLRLQETQSRWQAE